jgi:hypothetical protein
MPYSIAALLLGAQLMSIGFVAEMLTAFFTKDEDIYSVRETTPKALPARPSSGTDAGSSAVPLALPEVTTHDHSP